MPSKDHFKTLVKSEKYPGLNFQPNFFKEGFTFDYYCPERELGINFLLGNEELSKKEQLEWINYFQAQGICLLYFEVNTLFNHPELIFSRIEYEFQKSIC